MPKAADIPTTVGDRHELLAYSLARDILAGAL